MDTLKTVAIDITHSVFENDTDGIMYITKDIYLDAFAVSIPVYTFSSYIFEGCEKRDLDYIQKHFPISNHDQKEKLIEVIKQAIEEF